ncbi:MAG: glycosyltransferase family 4 protein [Pseudomonadota bacterium]
MPSSSPGGGRADQTPPSSSPAGGRADQTKPSSSPKGGGADPPNQTPSALTLICFLFDPNTGGPTIRVRAVYDRLQAMGHQVRVAYPKGEGSAAGYLAEKNIAVDTLAIAKPVLPSKPWAFLKFALTFPVALWRIAAYLRRQKPDAVHVNGAFDIGPALGARLAGIPVIWHLNDTLFGPRLSRTLGWVVRRVATKVAVSSDPVATHYAIPKDQATRLFVPVDTARFTPRAARITRKEPLIGLAGNWNWIKGQHHFVEAIARLRAKGRPARGTVLGRVLDSQTAYWTPIFERMKTDGLDRVIAVPGFVDDMPAALADLDILVLTSHSESGPLVTVEAMAAGVPQVVFDVGDVRTMLDPDGPEQAGLVVRQGDVAALVAGIERLLDDPALYAQMAAHARARVARLYALEACVAAHIALYRAAAGVSARPGAVDNAGETQ